MASFKYFPGICLEGLRGTIDFQDTLFPIDVCTGSTPNVSHMSYCSNPVAVIHEFGRPDILETPARGAVVCGVEMAGNRTPFAPSRAVKMATSISVHFILCRKQCEWWPLHFQCYFLQQSVRGGCKPSCTQHRLLEGNVGVEVNVCYLSWWNFEAVLPSPLFNLKPVMLM